MMLKKLVAISARVVLFKEEMKLVNSYYEAINWNAIEDIIDKSTWEKLTEQFWLDTRIPLSNDLDDWRTLTDDQKENIGLVFGGLTLLDTIQSESAIDALRPDVRTPHEEAVFEQYPIYGKCSC